MLTVARITFIGLFLFGLGASLKKSAILEESGSKRINSVSLLCNKLDNKTVLYYKETTDSNRLYLPINVLDAEDVFILYNALSMFTHTNDDQLQVKYDGLPFVVYGYYGLNTKLKVNFMVLMTERKAQLIQNRIREEFSKNISIFDENNLYTISPGIEFDFRHMFYKPSWQYILVITLQDYSRMQSYGPFINLSFYCIMVVSVIITIPGSILICGSILKYKHLQTPPNVYVFNIAIADILLHTFHVFVLGSVINIQLNTKNSSFESYLDLRQSLPWQWQHPPCQGPGYLIPSCWKVVCFTTVFTTIDRYIAICHPFLGHRISTYRRAVKINVSTWALSFITTLTQIVYDQLFSTTGDIYYDVYWLILCIVLPICIILPSYMSIALSLWKSSKMRRSCGTIEQPVTMKSIKIAGFRATLHWQYKAFILLWYKMWKTW